METIISRSNIFEKQGITDFGLCLLKSAASIENIFKWIAHFTKQFSYNIKADVLMTCAFIHFLWKRTFLLVHYLKCFAQYGTIYTI